MASVHLKYLAVNPVDLKWGTAVNSVGFQEIAPGIDYPPRNHPSRYVFSVSSGRILQEYQLLYITEGRGRFSCETLGRSKSIQVKSGMMFLLFPGSGILTIRTNRRGGRNIGSASTASSSTI